MSRALLALLAVGACSDRGQFTEPLMLGGRTVTAETLNQGRSAYRALCAPCHGDDGGGGGTLGARQKPAPRDLRLGILKYASVPAGSVPRDEDVLRVLRHGLAGTGMQGLPLPEDELDALVQYTKTLSPRRRTESPLPPVVVPPDPWGEELEAVARGRELYHGDAGCVACHPAYLPRDEARVRASAHGVTRSALGDAVTSTGPLGEVTATDFARDTLRTGNSATRLCEVIAAGVGGTEMRPRVDVLSDAQMWALAHYVAHVAAHGGDTR